MLDDLARAAGVRGDDWRARGHGFEHDVRESFVGRVQHECIRLPQIPRDLAVRHVAEEKHALRDSALRGELAEIPANMSVSGDDEARVRQMRQQADEGVHALPRHESADGEKRPAAPLGQRASGGRRCADWRRGVVDHLDLFRPDPPSLDDALKVAARHDDAAREPERKAADPIREPQQRRFGGRLVRINRPGEPAEPNRALPGVVAHDFIDRRASREKGGECGLRAEAGYENDFVSQRRTPDGERRAEDAQRPEYAAADPPHWEAVGGIVVIHAVAQADDFHAMPARGESRGHSGHVAGRTSAIGRKDPRDHEDVHRAVSSVSPSFDRAALAP